MVTMRGMGHNFHTKRCTWLNSDLQEANCAISVVSHFNVAKDATLKWGTPGGGVAP